MGNKTPLYNAHLAMGAKLVDFAGWDMPIHYGSQIEEHHAVRSAAGMCDTSNMTVVDLIGGVRVAIGDQVIDASVRAQLAALQSALKA